VAGLLLSLVASPLYADFGGVARAIDRQAGVKRVGIPFLGIARMLVRVVHPEGIRDFQLATFEGADALDPRELREIVESRIAPGFEPLVRSWSRASGEWSFIYAKPSKNGRSIELIVLAHDDEETVLVRVAVDADVVARRLDEPRALQDIALR
jgi:hypothetical protein